MASITFHPVVFSHHLREDGTTNVKIRVTFKRKDRKLPTTIDVCKADLTRAGKIKNQSIIDRLDAEVRRLRGYCDDLNAFALEEMDVDDVLAHIRKRQREEQVFRLDFLQWWDEVIATKLHSSGVRYRCAKHAFMAFIDRDSIDIAEITSALLRRYESWLIDKYGRNARAVSQYMQMLSSVHSEARRRYNSEELDVQPIRNPFEYYKAPKQAPAKVGHRNTTLEVLRMMVADRESLEGVERLGVDLFLISFALMGANTPDIYTMLPAVDGVLSYNRQKTRTRRQDGAPCKVRVEESVRQLLADHADPMGVRMFGFYHRYRTFSNCGWRANVGLRRWCERKGVQVVTIYSARHTWATMAYAMGVPAHVITDALVHKDASRRMDDIYTNKDWSVVWDANLRVIAPVFSLDRL